MPAPPRSGSEAVGVVHRFAAVDNPVPLDSETPIALCRPSTTAVGQNELPVAFVAGAHVARLKRTPLRIEPHAGKFSENDSSCWKKEDCADVLNSNPSWLHLANDPGIFVEQSAAIAALDACPFSGHGEVLAREAANDAIHKSTPRATVEGAHVRPHRRVVKSAVRHTRRQDAGRRDFPLHVANAASCRSKDSEAEVNTSAAGEQADEVAGEEVCRFGT